MSVCAPCVCTCVHMKVKGILILWNGSYRLLWTASGHWEVNPGLLEEKPLLLTREPSLQPQAKKSFKKSVM